MQIFKGAMRIPHSHSWKNGWNVLLKMKRKNFKFNLNENSLSRSHDTEE